ncbi:hypothetical protein BS639_17050 [Rouxiella silvae]|uniref:Uncharacterized protein n=1 Tax=Rouxiella silvae TaxID=1646373 RepID=A0ABX3TXM1_9GAMM|nr:hypothetical protein [Rouxiella silvae]ORJ20002.1 hypothetical protein BS639_17050 [Rouxiella silvae]
MSDKISERKPDGGLQEWIDFYEMAADGDEAPTELLMLLIELRAHRRRAAEVKPVELPEADLVYYTVTDTFGDEGCMMIPLSLAIAAIKAAGGTVAGE